MNNGHFNITSPSCSQKLSGYSAPELVLSIKTLVTFSDQRMTFPLGILMATGLKAGSFAQTGHRGRQWADDSRLAASHNGLNHEYIYFIIMLHWLHKLYNLFSVA